MVKILEFWNDFKKDFKENKKSYQKWCITGGVIYTLLGLCVGFYGVTLGIGGGGSLTQIEKIFLLMIIQLFLFAPTIIGFLFESLGKWTSFITDTPLLFILYFFVEFFVGYYIVAFIYYLIRKRYNLNVKK